MSTINRYELSAEEETVQRAREEIAQRRKELGRLRGKLISLQKKLAAELKRLKAMESKLAGIGTELASESRELKEVRAQISLLERKIREIQSAVESEMSGMLEAESVAVNAQQSIIQTFGETDDAAAALSDEAQISASLQAELSETLSSYSRINSELRLITADAELAAPAMLTVMAMKANSYPLREINLEEMTAYFESESGKHIIAVKLRPVKSACHSQERWDLEAETFGLAGDHCLDVLENLEESLLDSGVTMEQRNRPRFPKKDGESGISVPSRLMSREESAAEHRQDSQRKAIRVIDWVRNAED